MYPARKVWLGEYIVESNYEISRGNFSTNLNFLGVGMNRCKPIGALGILLFLVIACNPATVTPLDATQTLPQVTATTPGETITPKTTLVTTPIQNVSSSSS